MLINHMFRCFLLLQEMLLEDFFKIYKTLPVTFVPITRCMGISSGRSLKVCSSDIFLCCRSLIFVRLASRAPRSSSKKAGEHLEKGYKGLLMKAGLYIKIVFNVVGMDVDVQVWMTLS